MEDRTILHLPKTTTKSTGKALICALGAFALMAVTAYADTNPSIVKSSLINLNSKTRLNAIRVSRLNRESEEMYARLKAETEARAQEAKRQAEAQKAEAEAEAKAKAEAEAQAQAQAQAQAEAEAQAAAERQAAQAAQAAAAAAPSAQEAFAKITAEKGLSADEIAIWSWIINRESGWNHTAMNPYSGAYGLPQSLPAEKMASHGSDYRTNPETQLRWMYDYMVNRYGSISGAKAFWDVNGWY